MILGKIGKTTLSALFASVLVFSLVPATALAVQVEKPNSQPNEQVKEQRDTQEEKASDQQSTEEADEQEDVQGESLNQEPFEASDEQEEVQEVKRISVDKMHKDPFYWTGIIELPGANGTDGPTAIPSYKPGWVVAIVPFARMAGLGGLFDCSNYYIHIHDTGQYIQQYREDFKNSEAPVYKKWGESYLTSDEIEKIMSEKPKEVSLRDYFSNNYGFEIGSRDRYLVVDCLIDYTYRYCWRDDFEMRLSYFDIETGEYNNNKVVSKGFIASMSGMKFSGKKYRENPFDLRAWRSVRDLNAFANARTEVSLSDILQSRNGIFAIPRDNRFPR